jgi:hypothetical protein
MINDESFVKTCSAFGRGGRDIMFHSNGSAPSDIAGGTSAMIFAQRIWITENGGSRFKEAALHNQITQVNSH